MLAWFDKQQLIFLIGFGVYILILFSFTSKMDSSDSEDDCYGNIAQKLQRMKNNYKDDKIESSNLLNDSAEIDEIVKKANLSTKNELKSCSKRPSREESSEKEDQETVLLDNLLATSSKRVTRSAAKRTSSDTSLTEDSVPKKANTRKRGGKTKQKDASTNKAQNCDQSVINVATVQNTSSTALNNRENAQNSPRTRGRGRSRGGNRNRSRNYRQTVMNPTYDIPTYSVGNTEEYPDMSDCQQLFSSKPKSDDVVIVEEEEALDENEELSVKIYWQSSEIFKFMIRRFQKLTLIFDYFAKKENVSHDKLLFTFNDQILKPDDTPDEINYNIVKFIDGGIVNQSVSNLVKDDNKKGQKGIKIKFQCQNVKKPFETCVEFDEKLSIAMMKCAEHFETTLDKLRFEFDGDSISGKTTANDLELEGGECIDVKIIR